MISTTCERCNKSFETHACYLKRGQMKYCSRKCSSIKTFCKFENCGKPCRGQGFCSIHYMRFYKHGDPGIVKPKVFYGKDNYFYGVKLFGKDNPFYGKKHTEESNNLNRQKHIGKVQSEETKEKIRLSVPRGEKSPHWRGGPRGDYRAIRNSSEYKRWAFLVKKRDGFKCTSCGVSVKEKKLHADHIKPFSLFPELRFDLSNGRTLCVTCHRKTDTWGWSLYWRKKSMEMYVERTFVKQ